MARIDPLKNTEGDPGISEAFEQHMKEYSARITNMKATLGHSLISFQVYMGWYPLYEEVKQVVGKRLASLYAFSISSGSECPLCSTFFRKIIVDAGENPDALQLTETEQDLLNFGSAISKHKGHVSDDDFKSVRSRFSDKELVILVAFAGQMVATNVFSNVTQTDIDDYLTPYLEDNKIKSHG